MKRILLLFSILFVMKSNSQTLIAGWDFQTTTSGGTAVTAAPNSPLVYNANVGNGAIYLDGTNGSSTWTSLASNPEVTSFAGTASNAGGSTGLSTTTTSPACLAIANSSANGKMIILKFSMTRFKDLIVSYATQKTASGFSSQLWEYSTNGTSWSTVGTISSIPTSFGVQTLTTITGLDDAATAYLRLTVSGATTATGNNRIDNIQLNATPFSVATDYFRSKQTGNWSSTSTWQSSVDNTSWINATLTPDNNANSISILASHTITMDANTSVSNTSIAATGILNIAADKSITIPSGKTLTNNGTFALKSDATGTGRIANSSGSISGNVTVERFIPAKSTRRFSFITSPVSQALSAAWQQQIHITGAGSGGTVCPTLTAHSNGFDATVTNAPSMYSYDASQASGSRWVANTTGTTGFTLTPGNGYRLNVRGPRSTGCGLLDGSVTNTTAVTLSATGTVNNAAKNAGSFSNTYNNNVAGNWLLIGNPYPCELDFSAFQTDAANGNANQLVIATSYIIYDPSNAPDAITPANMYSTWNAGTWSNAPTSISGANGQYIANGQAFFVQAIPASNITLNFAEGYKYNGSQNGVFRTATPTWNEMLRVSFAKGNINIDQTVIRYSNEKGVEAQNLGNYDATLMSSGSNYLGTVKANKNMSIQTRPLQALSTSIDKIGMDFNCTQSGTYQLNFSDYDKFTGYDIYLIDNYTKTRTNIKQQNSYEFSVDKNNGATQGKDRFVLEIGRSIQPSFTQINSIKTYPNPANKQVTIELPQSNGSYTIKLTDVTGRIVVQQTAQAGVNTINLNKMAKGSYVVEITDAQGNRTTQKLVKQ